LLPILNNFSPKGLIGSCGLGLALVSFSTICNNFLASPLRLKIGLTKIYSTSAFSLNLTKPSVVFMFLNVITPLLIEIS